jgi:hypothetical protein
MERSSCETQDSEKVFSFMIASYAWRYGDGD